MKVFTRDYRITGDYPEPFSRYFEGLTPCVFDIETTGLDPSGCRVCLTALLTRTASGVRITQFLAENHYEEDKVLNATIDFLRKENIGFLITFNGQAFDVPFMNRRLERTFSEDRLSLFDFDLYRFLSKGTDLRKRLSSLSQKSVENYYGIIGDRQDTITGRESVALFNEYSLTGNSTIEKIILTHNREDVLHLHRLMYLAIPDVEDFDKAISVTGFPFHEGRFSVRAHLSEAKKSLQVRGDQLREPVSAAFFPDLGSSMTAVFNAASASYEIDVPVGRLETEDGYTYFLDARAAGIDVSDDPDCVNDYLILSPRTINLAAAKLLEQAVSKL